MYPKIANIWAIINPLSFLYFGYLKIGRKTKRLSPNARTINITIDKMNDVDDKMEMTAGIPITKYMNSLYLIYSETLWSAKQPNIAPVRESRK